jgi:hypothetical protein
MRLLARVLAALSAALVAIGQSSCGDRDDSARPPRADAPAAAADSRTVDALIDALVGADDVGRATAMVALRKLTRPEDVERLRRHGLVHADGVVRAYAARACGERRLASVAPVLRAMIRGDSFWMARAEAAITCGELGDVEAMAEIREMLVGDPSERARLAALGALGRYGKAASDAVPAIAENLGAPQWQLRVGACEALGRIESMEAIEPLIARMTMEPSGRVGNAIHDALVAIARDDIGRKPDRWQAWWGGEPTAAAGFSSGPEFHAHSIAFVLDTSESMGRTFEPDASAAKSLSRTYAGASKLAICAQEIVAALRTMDARAEFSLVAGRRGGRSFAERRVRPTEGQIAAADEWLRSLTADGAPDWFVVLRDGPAIGGASPDAPAFADTPDTVTFLVDAMPAGDPDVLLERYASANRHARVLTHVIALGATDADAVYLRRLAEGNGGRFTNLAGRSP